MPDILQAWHWCHRTKGPTMANANQTASTLPTSTFTGDKVLAYLPFTDERIIVIHQDTNRDSVIVVRDADADVSSDIIGGLYYPVGGEHFQVCQTLEHAMHVAATWQSTQAPGYICPRA